MAIGITAIDNGNNDSPGIDIELTGLTGYDTVRVERIDNDGFYSTVAVRGLDDVQTSATMVVTDYEAPIGHSVKYRVTGMDADPGIELVGAGAEDSGATSCAPSFVAGSVADD